MLVGVVGAVLASPYARDQDAAGILVAVQELQPLHLDPVARTLAEEEGGTPG
jgi:hypothetical protein